MHFGYYDTPEDRQYPDQVQIEIFKKEKWYDELDKQGYNIVIRTYPLRNKREHHRHHSFSVRSGEGEMLYTYRRGVCKILTIEYHDNFTDRMDVYMSFRPEFTRKFEGEEFVEQMILQDDYPTQDYIERHLLFPGVETDCIKKKRVRGKAGYKIDFLFPQRLRFDTYENDNGNQDEYEQEIILVRDALKKQAEEKAKQKEQEK